VKNIKEGYSFKFDESVNRLVARGLASLDKFILAVIQNEVSKCVRL